MDNPTALVSLKQFDIIQSIDDLMKVSELLLKSGLLPSAIKSKEATAAIILKGRELGIPTMESFAQIAVISGTPTLKPQGMIALARRTGELEDIKISDDGQVCTVTVKRRSQSPFTTRFSMEDARRMKTQEKGETIVLAEKYNWRQMPAVMRQWRAVSANFRITFPDVIGGMYTPEELGAVVDDESNVIEGEATVRYEPSEDRTPEPPLVEVAKAEKAVAPTETSPTPAYDQAARVSYLRQVRDQLRATGVTLEPLDPKVAREMEQDKLELMISDFETMLRDAKK